MTLKKPAILIVSVILVASLIAWLLDFLALAIASGGPHYEGSGLSARDIASRTATYHREVLLFDCLPALFFAAGIALWLLLRRTNRKMPT